MISGSISHDLDQIFSSKANIYWYIPYFVGYKTEFFFLPKQTQRSRSILQDGSRSVGLFRKGKIGIIAKFHRTDVVI